MKTIPIYEAERSIAGLADKMNNLSLAYVSQLEPAGPEMQSEITKAIANLQANSTIHASAKDSDLYFTKSILVSTVWNENDDVFSILETWKARHTPSHKPTNLEHDETQLVGHIVDCWPFDTEGNIIPDNVSVDNLPNKFHLVTGAVIYKLWERDELQERTAKLISQIEANEKFVSMEVAFTDFDYAIMTPDGKCRTEARNEKSAWMTKHLKTYGKSGVYDGYKIGRLVKNLTFCGKGYVDKPANPESIIFSNKNNGFNFVSASSNISILDDNGVIMSMEDTNSSCEDNNKGDDMDDNILKDQLAELKQANASLEEKLADVTNKLAKADVEKYTAQITELETTITSNTEELAAKASSIESLTTQVDTLNTKLDETNEAKAELQTKLAEVEAAKVTANRISTLVDGGIDKEVATTKVELFANLTDEQFTVVANELVEAAKTKMKKEDEDEDKDKSKASETSEAADETAEAEKDDAEANADEEVLETAEASTDETVVNTETEAEEDETVQTRNELREAVAAMFQNESKDTESSEGDK